ncbi:DUF4158 domain-containing protein [Streptomyces hokutonensis]|uniref:DUF4158 domain-containing protein n=1 Tax=Streptomyces hokutonensis TaxID=1306990 RepID=UPI003F53F25E
MQELERITARRNELDTLAEELATHLAEVQAEREELVIAERVLRRPAEQDRAPREPAAAVAPTAAREAYGYHLYEDHAAGRKFRAFLHGRAWTAHAEGPKALFVHAVGWLRRYRVPLPGVSVPARQVAEVRRIADTRLHTTVAKAARRADPALRGDLVGVSGRNGGPARIARPGSERRGALDDAVHGRRRRPAPC